MTLLLHSWPYVTGFLVVSGLCLVVWGAISWKKQQTRTDSREVAELAKLEAEREKTYQETLLLLREHQEPPEEAEKILEEKIGEEELGSAEESEASDELSSNSHGPSEPVPSEPLVRTLNPAVVTLGAPAIRARGRAVMDGIIEAFATAFGKGADIVPDVRLGGTHMDAVITSRLEHIPNLVLDVRLADGNLNNVRNRMNEAIVWAIRARRVGRKQLGTNVVPAVFLVVTDSVLTGQKSLFGDVAPSPRFQKVVRFASDILEEVADVEIPLNVVIAEVSSITPAALLKIDWRTTGARVIALPVSDNQKDAL
ncbi:hypothetical protein JD76_05546 [Micromonospora endolithica]|nr:hypothetical protein JD76_05546 [Micromonospora endolithica]